MAQILLDSEIGSLILNGTPILDFEAGDYLTITPVNPVTGRQNSSEGGLTINKRTDGGVADLVFRVQKFSASDVFLNNQLNSSSPVVFAGTWSEDFTRDGTEGVGSYLLEGGSFTTQPVATASNVEGNNLMEYTIQFRNHTRTL